MFTRKQQLSKALKEFKDRTEGKQVEGFVLSEWDKLFLRGLRILVD